MKESNIQDSNDYKVDVFEIAYLVIENHKPIQHVDAMLKFMKIFAEDERFLQLDVEQNEKGEITMCTILDAAINQGEILKLILLIQKKIKKGDSISKIADDLVEDEMTITPIYKIIQEYPDDTEKDIYQKLSKENKKRGCCN